MSLDAKSLADAAVKYEIVKLIANGGPLPEDVLLRRLSDMDIESDTMAHDLLADMVMKDNTLRWRLPPGVKAGSDEVGTAPLIYSLVTRK